VKRGGVLLVTALPAPELRASVRSYTGYAEPGSARVARRELPSGDVALVVGLGSPLRITDPRTGSVVRRSSFVAGVHEGHVLTETAGLQLGIEVRMTPTGAHKLLGVAMHTLANEAVALESLAGRDAGLLAEQLAALGDWSARFALLDVELGRLLRRGPVASPSVEWAWRRLVETSGRISVMSLVRELGCTRKHLAERFREQVGVSPKTLARVLRFERAVQAARRNGRPLAEIAADCGYYDQAHLNREFRDLAGATPSELRAVTFVQDAATRDV
jgi:AraC-like DNA-binding protein